MAQSVDTTISLESLGVEDIENTSLADLESKIQGFTNFELSPNQVISLFLSWLNQQLGVWSYSEDATISKHIASFCRALESRGFEKSVVLRAVADWKQAQSQVDPSLSRRFSLTEVEIDRHYPGDGRLSPSHTEPAKPEPGPTEVIEIDSDSSSSSSIVFLRSQDIDTMKSDSLPRGGKGSSPPKTYVCRRCGQKDKHQLVDCPTNMDPDFDCPPRKDYVCKICGIAGEHYIVLCPRNENPNSLTQRRKRVGMRTDSSDKEENNNRTGDILQDEATVPRRHSMDYPMDDHMHESRRALLRNVSSPASVAQHTPSPREGKRRKGHQKSSSVNQKPKNKNAKRTTGWDKENERSVERARSSFQNEGRLSYQDGEEMASDTSPRKGGQWTLSIRPSREPDSRQGTRSPSHTSSPSARSASAGAQTHPRGPSWSYKRDADKFLDRLAKEFENESEFETASSRLSCGSDIDQVRSGGSAKRKISWGTMSDDATTAPCVADMDLHMTGSEPTTAKDEHQQRLSPRVQDMLQRLGNKCVRRHRPRTTALDLWPVSSSDRATSDATNTDAHADARLEGNVGVDE
ncbi:uncharacterized protein E0L32_010093 [Thyridium curvatum]|uniref:Uncharacterized protein n=1 Tax=Thyridium curvatum TaxID=1093900 RepID=A0A507AP54_9PEZI|nr:uncharacterized protein E0L32_010093 [Thyridium curvatum]TPX08476.1 hypothetical protein E0L32_010093 [Thyridium curvatum]